ncbi:putative non-specific serine/threonine protein kinase [Helianthus annuus]|uniref:Non-specific serine/threonine protein kinase n=1 Tax=Helianthus annuus TaxID=4232 RepID=A0A251UW36_HELAN|nr:putative non-specific serine/threonine protein kinase [Helianthus annuus]KAJ0579510.1 putative non-specific serine/threonine protein kinase [Helianthus annuus]KAJ0586736.1 putative non-specific serine/threonine protein kinase [Helianthus annuus]KAJ0595409.1 putative non-specific serine/threonine protein kinase [Helianthus annuus]KAJ0756085.1 putative non-specific serine/threonine protein kinase [Helianthus annuus]
MFTNLPRLTTLKLSNNSLHDEVLSGYLNVSNIDILCLDSNSFTGKVGNQSTFSELSRLDISSNLFTGVIPDWISNISTLSELVVKNNSLRGQFPCGGAPFFFLDISQNYFSGAIPSCLNFQNLEYLHLGSNKFTGPIPSRFRNLTSVITLDIGNNYLSSSIPEFFGELSNLRILTHAMKLTWTKDSGLQLQGESELADIPDEVLFTTKSLSLTYKGGPLNIMSGLDISCNKLTGDIPEELGLLTQIHVLNLSHNRLTGPIPAKFSNLANIESLDLSFNRLTGEVPSELVKLNSLAVFNVSFNNLSGRLPEMKAQFGTFGKESYEGNPLLCGLPLENKCLRESQGSHPSYEKGSDEKWYEMDMVFFFGSFGSTWFVFVLRFAAVLYINPGWRMLWLNMIEEFMYTCYYFLFDSARNVYILFRKQGYLIKSV